MKLAILCPLALAIGAVLGGEADCSSSKNITVETSTGTYTGLIDPAYPRTRQFRAIPFAQPPVASRRFSPPEKLPPSKEHHWSTRFPPSCAQFVTSAPISIYDLPLTKGNLIYNGYQNDTSGLVGEATSEDCLYLAVWTPTTPPPEGGFPVLFFMTGGGWIIGGVDIPWQYGAPWVERSQSHIIVTINFRLNIFGFPHARALPDNHQNLGILDQRMALEWVRDNIQAFGGDPSRITQWGQSSGAAGTDIHAYAFRDDPIVQGYFLESGNVLSTEFDPVPSYSNFSFVARHMGCAFGDSEDDAAAELDCMRQVPFTMIENFIGPLGALGENTTLNWKPFVDNHIIWADWKARAEAGLFARRPVIISATANEFSSLVPWPVDNLTAGPYQPTVTFYDVLGIVCPVYNSTVYRNRVGPDVPVYRIQHAGTFPNLNVYSWLGAYHASDLPIIFGTYHDLDGVANTTQFEVDVSHATQDHILAFAKDPYHGPQELGWKPMVTSDPNGGQLVRFGADGKVVQHIDGVEVDGVCLGIRDYDPFP
jgi:acetylcholinesterase